METLNNILRIQPKTRIMYDRKTRRFGNRKAWRIPYEDREPLDNTLVESTLSELRRRTRRVTQPRKNQYMPSLWTRCVLNPHEQQEHFDECIYEQQLTQRLGPEVLTQQPPLEWISEKEASSLLQVNFDAVQRSIQEGRLKVLQRAAGQQMLIYLDQVLFDLAFPKSNKSQEQKSLRIQEKLSLLRAEIHSAKYEEWILAPVLIERIWPEIFVEKHARACLVRKEVAKEIFNTFRNIAALERGNYPVPYINLDDSYFNTLLSRADSIYLGKPPLRFFTTEEAAFYLRTKKQTIIDAIGSGELTPMKTGVGKQYIFEKQQLLAYAGPSSNPITATDSTEKILRWVAKEFHAEFTAMIPPEAESRMFMSEIDIECERKKIKESFILLTEVSFPHRAQNLFFFNQLLHPNIQYPPTPMALRGIKELKLQPLKDRLTELDGGA